MEFGRTGNKPPPSYSSRVANLICSPPFLRHKCKYSKLEIPPRSSNTTGPPSNTRLTLFQVAILCRSDSGSVCLPSMVQCTGACAKLSESDLEMLGFEPPQNPHRVAELTSDRPPKSELSLPSISSSCSAQWYLPSQPPSW